METLNKQLDYLKNIYIQYSDMNIDEKEFEEVKEEEFVISELYPIQDLQFVAFFFDWWIPLQDEALDDVEPFSDTYADLLAQRGFTFDEFKWILNGRLDDDQYIDERAFQYLYINDTQEHNRFKSTHAKTHDEENLLETYKNAIEEAITSEHTLLYEFFFNSKVAVYTSKGRLKRHAYIPAGSGSGKSEVMKYMFHNLAKNPKTNLSLIEPHMDFSLEVLQFSLWKKCPERVIFLDPFIRRTAKFLLGENLLKEDHHFIINPFDIRSNDEELINAMVQELSSAFFSLLKSDASEQMEVIIESCVEVLLRGSLQREIPYDITDLKRFMSEEENADLVSLGKRVLKKGVSKDIIVQLAEQPKGKVNYKSTRDGIYMRLSKLLRDDNFRKLLTGKSTIDIGKAVNSGKIIICNFSEALMGSQSSSAMGKFYISLLQAHAIKRALIPKKFRPISFAFVDECHEFLTPTLKRILTGARKYNLFMVMANQFIGQNMDTQMKRTILANTGIKIAGSMDSTSVDAICREMGELTPKHFHSLEPYHFYLYDNKYKEMGARNIRVPDYLVKKKPPFYMKKKHLRAFLLEMVHKSGFYVETSSQPKQERKDSDNTTLSHPTDKDFVFNPKFDD